MDLTVISTFRCNSKCQMCYIWKNPTDPREEISLETLSKLPPGFDNLNVSGGEPTLRKDPARLSKPSGQLRQCLKRNLFPRIGQNFPDVAHLAF